MRFVFTALFLSAMMVKGSCAQGQSPLTIQPIESKDCLQGEAQLTARQTKIRLRHKTPVSSLLLYKSLRITNAVLVFKIATDQDGNVACISAVSGHPLLLGVAIDSLRNWKFKPTVTSGRRRSILGTLVLALSPQLSRLRTSALNWEPKATDPMIRLPNP